MLPIPPPRALAALLSVLFAGCGAGPNDPPALPPCPATFQQCGSNCGTCDDADPLTQDRCLFAFTCGHLPLAAPCIPTCPAPPLHLAVALRQGSGGLPGLHAPFSVALGPNGDTLIVASAPRSAIQTLNAQNVVLTTLIWAQDGFRVGPILPAPGVTALSRDGLRLFATGPGGTQRYLLPQAPGPPTPDAQLAGPGHALDARQGRVALLTDTALELLTADGTPIAQTPAVADALTLSSAADYIYIVSSNHLQGFALTADSLQPVADHQDLPGLAGAQALALSRDSSQLYVAGFCDHRVAVFDRDADTGGLTFRGATDALGLPDCATLQAAPNATERLFQDVYRAFPAAIAALGDGRFVTASFLGERVSLFGPGPDGLPVLQTRLSEVPAALDFDVDTEDELGQHWWDRLRASATIATASDTDRVVIASRIASSLHILGPQDGQLVTTQVIQSGDGGVTDLSGAYNVRLSPDGDHLYVAARNHGQIAAFATDPQTAGLTPLPTATIPNEGPFQGAITNVFVAPDGLQVFAVDAEQGALQSLDRDPETGLLTWRERLRLGHCGPEPAFPVVVVTAPDGRDVYVGDFHFQGPSCLRQFRRAPDGSLTEGPILQDAEIAGVESIALTRDGRHAYTAAHVAAAATRWIRDPQTGLLAEPDALVRDDLRGAEFIALCPDESTVYVTSPTVNTLVALRRDPADGRLSWLQTLTHGDPGLPALRDTAGLATSPSGDRVFVASRVSSTITVLNRATDGRLTPQGTVVTLPSLDWVNGLAMSPDGRQLFAAAVRASAVTAFRVTAPGADGCGALCP